MLAVAAGRWERVRAHARPSPRMRRKWGARSVSGCRVSSS